MSLESGTRLGPYEILAELGRGGMGEVYRAADTRLKRDVAVKVLPSAVAQDAERLRRFEQEALATAALNHPNILVVHDTGREGDTAFVVSELLEGRTMREVIDAGAVPLRKAIDYATQVALGLAAAHGKGIVHRDLKPENLFVTTEDRVKILDFGLAKAGQTRPGPAPEAATMLASGTEPGIVLGTIGYMAPEQVRGLAVDHRADIFSFGAVLYELATGRRAFMGATPADTMTAILKEPPAEISASGRSVPAGLARVIDRCLEKPPAARFQSASDLAFALQSIGDSMAGSGAMATMPEAEAGRKSGRWAVVAASLVAGAALGAISTVAFRPATGANSAGDIALAMPLPPNVTVRLGPAGARAGGVAVSPDGRSIVFVGADGNGENALYIRNLSDAQVRKIPGSEGGVFPFWSADGTRLAFCQRTHLRHIAPDGGSPETLVEANCASIRSPFAWRADGTFLGPLNYATAVLTFAAGGGNRAQVISNGGRMRVSYFTPVWLDRDRFLIVRVAYSESSLKEAGVFAGTIGSSELKSVVAGRISGVAVDAGQIFYLRGTDLVSQPFDDATTTAVGTPRIIASGVRAFSAAGGTVAWWAPESDLVVVHRLVMFDRSGTEIATIGRRGTLRDPRISPDGRMLAVARADEHGQFEIWTHDLARGIDAKASAFGMVAPSWMSDSRSFSAGATEQLIFRMGQSGSEPALPTEAASPNLVTDWHPEGKLLLGQGAGESADMKAYFRDGSPPAVVVEGSGRPRWGVFDPTGKWVAFASDDSGQLRVSVAPFPGPGPKIPVASIRGAQPRWRRDGRELFFQTTNNQIAVVPVTWDQKGTPDFGPPKVLFRIDKLLTANFIFDVTPDGQKFVAVVEGQPDPTPIMVRVSR